jgi:CheY-like chemotaxis protein
LARELAPDGIVLDLRLPDVDGWDVLEGLREDSCTRHIPIHVISAADGAERARAMGAVGYVRKPASREQLMSVVGSLVSSARPILVVQSNPGKGKELAALLNHEGFAARHVPGLDAALDMSAKGDVGCIVVDLELGESGLDALARLKASPDGNNPPLALYTDRALTKEEVRHLSEYADTVVLNDGPSTERLVQEMRLFVRHIQNGAHGDRASPGSGVAQRLDGACVLVADDDMRTVYALSALLRSKGAQVLVAETGRVALDLLQQTPDVSCVLMDIMMPEMDGYEATRRIRELPRFAGLPIIALTAKAMATDRDKCLALGANDYLSKPVDGSRLLERVSFWLSESKHATAR